LQKDSGFLGQAIAILGRAELRSTIKTQTTSRGFLPLGMEKGTTTHNR
jgi:hypothetical protein